MNGSVNAKCRIEDLFSVVAEIMKGIHATLNVGVDVYPALIIGDIDV
jgi:hypothetical protein